MVSQPYVDGITGTVTRSFASSLTASQIGTAAEDTVSVSVVCPDRWFPGDFTVVTSRDGRAFAGQVEGLDVCTGEITVRGAGQLTPRAARLGALPGPVSAAGLSRRHRPPAHLVVPGQVIRQPHQAIRGMTIMNVQILPAGTDRDYAAALDWIKQTAASGKTLSPPEDERPAEEELVAALLPVITSEHATAIVAQQIRQTLSAPWPAPAQGVAPADHGTFRYAGTVIAVSEICAGCGRYYDLPTEADQVMRVAVQQDGIGRVLVQCKDIEACYERWSSIVTYF